MGSQREEEPLPEAIKIRGVRKTFGPKVAVENLDLDIPEGCLMGFIGPNGAGKTTTIRMVMSIIFPDKGEISVLGKASAVESKDRIGYLPEERGLYKKMKVGAFLKYVARLKDIDDVGLEKKVKDWLERVGLGDCYRKRCEELSKGMQQKVQYIAAVIHAPDLLILDEPFSGLDPVNSRLLRQLVHEQHERGCTLIFSTHQMSQAEALCERVVMIHQGKKVLDNTLGEIRARYVPREILVEPSGVVDVESVRRAAGAGVQAVERKKGLVSVHLADNVPGDQVIGRIVAGIPVNKVELVRQTLEDVFIDIVITSAQSEQERKELLTLMHVGAEDDAGDGSGD
jgi:ABC-2 type transport system ATP-binding protein